MKKLFLRLVGLVIILAVLDQGVGLVLGIIRDHSPDGRYYKAKYTLETAEEDIIIIGSSRGERDYVPYLMEEAFGLSCWNASRGGQGLPYFRAMQEGILNRYKPKLVILNLEVDILEHTPFYQQMGFMRAFYKKHQEIRPILNKISPNEKWKLSSNIYAYNSSYYYLLRPYLFPGLDGKNSDKGWKPSVGIWEDPGYAFEVVNTAKPLHETAVGELVSLVEGFIAKDIPLIFSIAPNYGERTEMTSSLHYIQDLAKKHDIPLFNFSSDTTFVTTAEYFIDIEHLNVEGAILFTSKLIECMKDEIAGLD